jgi:hypothetical protein
MFNDNQMVRKLKENMKRVNAINPTNGEKQTVKEAYMFNAFRRGYARILDGDDFPNVMNTLLDVFNEVDTTEYEPVNNTTSVDVLMSRKYLSIHKEFSAYCDFRRDSGADTD